jgi:hypothetical protein
VRDDGHGGDLQAAREVGRAQVAHGADAEGQPDHQQRRRPGEPDERGDRAGHAGARQAEAHAHLRAGRSGQELAERDEVGIAPLVHPTAAAHDLLVEVAEVGHRPAEGGQAEAREREQHLQRRAAALRHRRWGVSWWGPGRRHGRQPIARRPWPRP